MLIGQITDIHIGFDRGNPDEPNQHRLEAVLKRLADGPNCPDLLLITGDLTEHGDAESYARLASTLASCPFPCWPIPGNHDDREGFVAAFLQVRADDGFCHYAIDAGSCRIVMLDTFEPGRHGGAFCEARAAWLREQLSLHPDTPTIIAMHHPPFEAGIPWMDTVPKAPWVDRFAEAISGHHQIRAILCGHVHRVIVSPWKGVTTIVCPSVAPAVALDLNPIDLDGPDDRTLISGAPPGYALHRFNGRELVSHFDDAVDYPVYVRFDERHCQLVAGMLGEQP